MTATADLEDRLGLAHPPSWARVVATTKKLPLGPVVLAAIALMFLPFARLGVDPHHDGIMLRPALVVARGGVIHRDAFSQYGPMAAWVQGIGVLVFGPTLFAIRVTTVIALAAAAGMFASAWSRLYGRGVALWAVGIWVLLTPFFSSATPMHPWSSDVGLAFEALTLLALIKGIRRTPSRPAGAWIATGGAAAAATAMARITVGGVLLAAIAIVLAAVRMRSALVAFVAGATSALLAAALYLGLNGALDDWWDQAILVPLRWHHDTIGAGGEVHLRDRLTQVAVPGLILAAAAVWLVIRTLTRTNGRDRVRIAMASSALVGAVAIGLAWAHVEIPFWNRGDAFWVLALAGLVVPAVVVLVRRPRDRDIGRLLAWTVGVSTLVQIYPVADVRHLWWSILPVLGPLGAAVVALTRRTGTRTLAATTLLLLVPFAARDVRATLRAPRVSMADTPVLDHMLMDTHYASYFTANLRAVRRYLDAHGNPPMYNLCADGLFAALSPNLAAPDPYFVFWPLPRPLDEDRRGRFILGRRPIAWLCPPAPNAKMLARGWGYRLLPTDPALAGDPAAGAYPNVSIVAVPAEWAPLEPPGPGGTRPPAESNAGEPVASDP